MNGFLTTFAMLLGSMWFHSNSAAADNPMERFLQAKQAYYESLRRSAEEYLQEIYENTDPGTQARIPRSNIRVEIRTGADRECYSAFKVGYFVAQKNVIVICEEDVSAATDYNLGWLLMMGAGMHENPNHFETASARDKPVPEKINRQLKARLLQMAQYLVKSNKRAKDQLFVTRRYGLSPCRAWEAAYRIIHAPSSLDDCLRNSLSPQEAEQSARWGVEVIQFGLKATRRFMGAQQPEQQVPELTAALAEAAMNEVWSEIMDRFLYYVVAHELGHAVNSANEAKMEPRDRELSADRFAASAINTFMARAVALPTLSSSLDVLWVTAKDPAVMDRADSLHTVVFCERELKLRSHGTTPFDEQLIKIMGRDCPRP